ncbi:MAG: hypothetical protein WCF03_08935, partial [Nitrososphaeraceae archaeon]
MKQKNSLLLVLGLTLAFVTALTLAPVLNDEMAYARGNKCRYVKKRYEWLFSITLHLSTDVQSTLMLFPSFAAGSI